MRTSLVLLALLVGTIRSGLAQWYMGLEVATTRYGGSAHDTSSGHVASNGGPGDAMAVGLRLGRQGRGMGISVRASYATPGFAVSGQDVTVIDKTTGQLLELASLFSTRVGGIGPSGAIRAELGPALHLWDFDGEIRARVGGIGAAEYLWPVAGRFSGTVRVEGMLSKSWFDPGDVPPEFERRITWRYGVSLGLRYRL